MKIIEIQPLVDIIALSLQSTFIKNEANGVSLLLIASPETAKTSTLFKFFNLDFVQYYDEVTQKKLIDDFLPLIKSKQARTLIVPDLVNCVEKQKSTRDQFLNMIKTGIDDTGIIKISTHHKHLDHYNAKEGLKFNMITAITSDNFRSLKKPILESGLLSRFIPFSYNYSISLVKKIFNMVEGRTDVEGTEIVIPKIIKVRKVIEGNPGVFKDLEIVSQKIGMDCGAFGIRSQVSLQRLVKANAMLNGRKKVIREDVDKIINLSEWINLKHNNI